MNERLNQRLSDWFDRSGSELVELNEALDAESCEEAAESLVIHGLLSDLGRRDEDRDAARILALMQSIDAEQASRPSLIIAIVASQAQPTNRLSLHRADDRCSSYRDVRDARSSPERFGGDGLVGECTRSRDPTV